MTDSRLTIFRKTEEKEFGGSYVLELSEYSRKYALLSLSSQDAYYLNPEIEEYLVDILLLDEIDIIFRANNISEWSKESLTSKEMFSEKRSDYFFSFGDEKIKLSSHGFSENYAAVLERIESIIDEYRKMGDELPVLKLSDISEDEFRSLSRPDDGMKKIAVRRYFGNILYYSVLNGSDENIEVSSSCSLVCLDTGDTIYENDDSFAKRVFSHSSCEFSLKPEYYLGKGQYKLISADLECEFYIE